MFLVNHTGNPPTKLSLDQLNAEVVLAFLKRGEEIQHHGIVTRNLRLSALRTFFTYLITQDPLRAGQYQRVISIPLKQSTRPVMDYLELDEIKSILDLIDQKKPLGRRDYVLLNLLYNTGARVQEVCDLRTGDIQWNSPPLVTITGKRNKTRQIPLWPETVALLKAYLTEQKILYQPEEKVFQNARGGSLTRFGIYHIIKMRTHSAIPHCPSLARKKITPHTLRHTTAMHMLQAGVDLTVIKNWLGHAHLTTTHAYVEIDLEMKRKALSTIIPLADMKQLQSLLNKNQDIISWLESL